MRVVCAAVCIAATSCFPRRFCDFVKRCEDIGEPKLDFEHLPAVAEEKADQFLQDLQEFSKRQRLAPHVAEALTCLFPEHGPAIR